jgi:hypothetical protein
MFNLEILPAWVIARPQGAAGRGRSVFGGWGFGVRRQGRLRPVAYVMRPEFGQARYAGYPDRDTKWAYAGEFASS